MSIESAIKDVITAKLEEGILDEFKIYLSNAKIEIDSDYLEGYVQPEAEPEASFS